MEQFRPEKRRKVFARVFDKYAPTPDPWEGFVPTGDLEADSAREAYALLEALTSVKPPEQLTNITDSDIWTCIVFESSEDAVKFVDDFGLGKFGDKYMDGSGWLAMMEQKIK